MDAGPTAACGCAERPSADLNAAKATTGRLGLFQWREPDTGGRGDRRHEAALINVLRAPELSHATEPERFLTKLTRATLRRTIQAGGLLAVLALGGCQKSAESNPADPYAGLDKAILAWRGDIDKSPECAKTPDGAKGCQTFEVNCKVEAPVTAADKGVSAKIVAAMSWGAWSKTRGDYEPASGGATFAKTQGKWVRHDLSGPVNLSTCATS